MSYQHTPRASKGNAFCWTTWQPCIDWKPRPQNLHQTSPRAAVEPLPATGLSTSRNPLDAARIAIAAIRKGARRAR
jgi:hypothetical protein